MYDNKTVLYNEYLMDNETKINKTIDGLNFDYSYYLYY